MIPVPGNKDPKLLREALEGNGEAFRELVERYAFAVRAIVEARRPGSSENGAVCSRIWLSIRKTLRMAPDPDLLAVHFVRNTRAELDLAGLSASDPGPACPPYLAKLSLEEREALYFEHWAKPRVPFPAHEHFGITETAYQAREERAERVLRSWKGFEDARCPDAPTEEQVWQESLEALREQDLLSDTRRKAPGALPRMPVPLAFFLTLFGTAILVSLLFRPGDEVPSRKDRGPRNEVAVAADSEIEVSPRVRIRAAAKAELWRRGTTEFRLAKGRCEIRDQGNAPLVLLVGSSRLVTRRGRFTIERQGKRVEIVVHQGRARWRSEAARGRELEQGSYEFQVEASK